MPTHVRTQIRAAVAAALAGLPLTGSRVYVGRTRPLAKDHDPTILIYTPSETSGRDANGTPPILARSLTLFVEFRVSTASPPDDLLDDGAASIEPVMWANKSLGGLLLNMQMISAEQQVEAQGESHIGGLRIEYRLTYRTREGDPTGSV